jgi:uncharacterized membrane protein YdjX (TVP38/TMEM64 family)
MKARQWIIIAIFVALFGAFFAFGLGRYLTLDALRDNRAALQAFVAAHGLSAGLSFVVLYMVAVALSFPGATILTLAGGFLFGTFLGAALSVTGATAGAAVLFVAAKTAFGDSLRHRAGPFLSRMADGFEKNAFNYLLVLRLIPVFPFCAINLGAALLGMRFAPFVLGTALGIIPGGLAYSAFGAGLGKIFDAGGAVNLSSILSPQLIAGLAGLSLLALAPIALQRLRRKA